MTISVNDRVHLDIDHEEWGRVASDGTVTSVFSSFALVEVDSIRASVAIPIEELHLRRAA